MYYNPVAKHNNCFLHVTRMPCIGKKLLFDIYHNDVRIVKNLQFINQNISDLKLLDSGLALVLCGKGEPSARAWVYRDCVTIEWTGLTPGAPLVFTFTPDATDVFEVRKLIAEMPRKIAVSKEGNDELKWHYDGADNTRRSGKLECSGQNETLVFSVQGSDYTVTLVPSGTSASIYFHCTEDARPSSYDDVLGEYRALTKDLIFPSWGVLQTYPGYAKRWPTCSSCAGSQRTEASVFMPARPGSHVFSAAIA